MCTGCNQRRLATDSVRTRSWSGDSKNHRVWDFDAGSWHEMCRGKIHSIASATGAEGASCCSWENCVRSQGAYFEGDWGVIVLCAMFLLSSLINASIFQVTWLDPFWTDLPIVSTIKLVWIQEKHNKSKGSESSCYYNTNLGLLSTYFVPDIILSSVCILTQSSRNLWSRQYFYFHFTNENIEAQKGKVTWSHS